jgi:hypothetical protein
VTDHRRIQRALFRMQLDPRFADRLRAGDSQAVASTGLEAGDLELLAGAEPAAVSADRDGKRRAQFLRNVASEFALSLALAPDRRIAEEFPESLEFHSAVESDASLPLAFARHLEKRVTAAPLLVRAVAALECALAAARRARRTAPALGPGEVALAPWVELHRAPAGTLDAAARVRAALDRGESLSRPAVSADESEILLLRREPAPAPFRLPAVEVESLSPDLAELLALAAKPLAMTDRAAHAREASVSPAELEEVVGDLVAERILCAG